MSGTYYIASEDSALLRNAFLDQIGGSCLEIGAGNGGNLVDLTRRFELVVGTDLVRPGMSDWRDRGANFVLADSASCIKTSAFDLVVFNPPYVAAEIEDRAVDGGRGLEVPKKFLDEALRVVKSSGRVIFLLSSDARPSEFEVICARKGFSSQRMATSSIFFEEISVYVARRRETQS